MQLVGDINGSNEARSSRTAIRRSGFSLLEIIFVLAVFFMISSLAVPMVLRTFSGQQLKSAADVVRAGFAQARVQAIESGDVYGFFYLQSKGDYFIAPMVTGFRSIVSGSQTTAEQNVLDDNIVFAAGETMQDARSEAVSEDATMDISSARPILFYPDGTSQDATVILQHQSGALIQVNLRGLTGNSSVTRIMSPEELTN